MGGLLWDFPLQFLPDGLHVYYQGHRCVLSRGQGLPCVLGRLTYALSVGQWGASSYVLELPEGLISCLSIFLCVSVVC